MNCAKWRFIFAIIIDNTIIEGYLLIIHLKLVGQEELKRLDYSSIFNITIPNFKIFGDISDERENIF
jgi:hypothetical protein